MDDKFFDLITTIFLALIPLILFFQDIIIGALGSQSPIILIGVQIFLAFLSQYAADRRVAAAVEVAMKWRYIDYLTTILYAVGPLAVAYQALIIQSIPAEFVPVAVLIFAGISQFTSEKRVKATAPLTP